MTNVIMHSTYNKLDICYNCYDLVSKLREKHTLVLSNTRELNRVPSTTNYLIYKLVRVYAILL